MRHHHIPATTATWCHRKGGQELQVQPRAFQGFVLPAGATSINMHEHTTLIRDSESPSLQSLVKELRHMRPVLHHFRVSRLDCTQTCSWQPHQSGNRSTATCGSHSDGRLHSTSALLPNRLPPPPHLPSAAMACPCPLQPHNPTQARTWPEGVANTRAHITPPAFIEH